MKFSRAQTPWLQGLTLQRPISFLCLAAMVCFTAPAEARNMHHPQKHTNVSKDKSFGAWVSQLKQELEQKGFDRAMLNEAFEGVHYNAKVIKLDRKQPETTMTFQQYMKLVVNDARIAKGKVLSKQHETLLHHISEKYSVQPQYIVALWGVETNFGERMGDYSIIEALSTLAYEGRRAEFFKGELINALKMIDQDHITPQEMKGSWAGAMGQTQFMPSSFLSFAVDYNGDGKKDIWRNTEDALASIANYLSSNNWQGDKSWGQQVTLPANFKSDWVGKNKFRTVAEWRDLGVEPVKGTLASMETKASIVQPGGGQGKAFIVYANFHNLLKWNRSDYFATAVGTIADSIAAHN